MKPNLTVFVVGMMLLMTKQALAQGDHHFDTASVKVTSSSEQGTRIMFDPNHFLMTNTTVQTLLGLAYDVEDYQLADVPSWVNTLHVDVEAKVDVDPINEKAAESTRATVAEDEKLQILREELRNLLKERFFLKVEKTTEEKPAYLLIIEKGKNGPIVSRKENGVQTGPGHLRCSHSSMADLAEWLSQATHRKVVDQTGLAGFYTFTLDWDPMGGMGSKPNALPTIFSAVQEQLGLKLTPGKAPTSVLHIVSISKPTSN